MQSPHKLASSSICSRVPFLDGLVQPSSTQPVSMARERVHYFSPALLAVIKRQRDKEEKAF